MYFQEGLCQAGRQRAFLLEAVTWSSAEHGSDQQGHTELGQVEQMPRDSISAASYGPVLRREAPSLVA